MHESTSTLHKTPALKFVGHFTVHQKQNFPPHRHQGWEIIYLRSGHITCIVENTAYDMTPGSLVIIPPRALHEDRAHSPYAHTYIWLKAQENPPWPQSCLDTQGSPLATIFDTLVREWSSDAPYRSDMLEILVAQLDLLLRRSQKTHPLDPIEGIVQRVEQQFEEYYATPVKIMEVAQEVGVSPSSLRNYFKQQRGMSPLAYLHQVRLRHALNHIQNSDLALEAIAQISGFHSASHLSRHIKRATGKTPGAFRHTR